jgi:hypothetical protein
MMYDSDSESSHNDISSNNPDFTHNGANSYPISQAPSGISYSRHHSTRYANHVQKVATNTTPGITGRTITEHAPQKRAVQLAKRHAPEREALKDEFRKRKKDKSMRRSGLLVILKLSKANLSRISARQRRDANDLHLKQMVDTDSSYEPSRKSSSPSLPVDSDYATNNLLDLHNVIGAQWIRFLPAYTDFQFDDVPDSTKHLPITVQIGTYIPLPPPETRTSQRAKAPAKLPSKGKPKAKVTKFNDKLQIWAYHTILPEPTFHDPVPSALIELLAYDKKGKHIPDVPGLTPSDP